MADISVLHFNLKWCINLKLSCYIELKNKFYLLKLFPKSLYHYLRRLKSQSVANKGKRNKSRGTRTLFCNFENKNCISLKRSLNKRLKKFKDNVEIFVEIQSTWNIMKSWKSYWYFRNWFCTLEQQQLFIH